MSATGRGAKRAACDYYPTPSWCVRAMLRAIPLPAGRWLEPGAGEGAIVRAVNAYRSDVRWTAVELREGCRPFLMRETPDVVIADFTTAAARMAASGERFAVAVGNPPFSLALQFVQQALVLADQAVLLLRLNWLEGRDRAPWLRRYAPNVYVLPERPSFTSDGKTDATAYAWFHWPSKHERRRGLVEVLDLDADQMALALEVP